jgi:tripartite-type tricarboxylate transporter receptor subunit TctC
MHVLQRHLSVIGIAVVIAAVSFAVPAFAQQYPSQDIHFVTGFPPGSGADVITRFFAEKMRILTGRAVVVENKVGAAGGIAIEYAAKAKPDGYTVLLNAGSATAASMHLLKKPPVDATKAFEIAGTINRQAFMLVVDAKSPYKTVQELTAAMKAKGDKASYPTTNNPALILGEAYKKAAGLNTVQVGYKTSADFINDMLGGRLDWVWADPVFGLARIREGKMKPLAISTGKRISALPDIPTAKEAGIVDIDMNLWWLTAVPTGTPQPIVDKLNAWFTEIGKMPETKEFLGKNGAEPWTASVAETTALIDKEIKDWKGYVELGKIEAQ